MSISKMPRTPVPASDPKAEELSGNTRGTLAVMRARRRGPPFYKLPTGRVVYDAADLIAWRRSREAIARVEPVEGS